MFDERLVNKILCEVTLATVLLLLPKDKFKPYSTLEFEDRSVVQFILSLVELIEMFITEVIVGAGIKGVVKLKGPVVLQKPSPEQLVTL